MRSGRSIVEFLSTGSTIRSDDSEEISELIGTTDDLRNDAFDRELIFDHSPLQRGSSLDRDRGVEKLLVVDFNSSYLEHFHSGIIGQLFRDHVHKSRGLDGGL